MSSERWNDARVAEAERALVSGWRLSDCPEISLQPPIAWDDMSAKHRSCYYHLHTLEPIALALTAHDRLGEERWIEHSLPIALDWLRAHPTRDVGSQFAWYDMAVGLRAYRLAYLLDVVARDPSHDDEVVARLLDGVLLHLDALSSERDFAGHSNHGLYQAAGQLAAATRLADVPGMAVHRSQAVRRLMAMLEQQFTEEGVHREHSPGYHFLILETVERIVASGLVDDPDVRAAVERAEEALAWFILPNGTLARIGDTDERTVAAPFDRAASPTLRFMATGGRDGEPPRGRLRAFPRSGYLIFRHGDPLDLSGGGDGAHLMQNCAFHSRAHKHADDLSFTWFERGAEVLVDAGRYAYAGRLAATTPLGRLGHAYSDPRRVYVESTRAHNTVEVDRSSHDRRREPYGSALRHWGATDGFLWGESEASLGTVTHRRLLAYAPQRWLVVLDDLDDVRRRPHHFSQRWHFAPEHPLTVHPNGVELAVRDATLHMLALRPAGFTGVESGRTEPDLLGWISRRAREFRPAPTAAYVREGTRSASFATLFWWGEERPQAAAAESATPAITWTVGNATHALTVSRDRGGAPVPRLD